VPRSAAEFPAAALDQTSTWALEFRAQEWHQIYPLVGKSTHGSSAPDHRFEWARQEFREWADRISSRFGNMVRFVAVGPEDEKLGSPTQMAIFDGTAGNL